MRLAQKKKIQRQSIFISYSHKDEEWKDRLLQHLGILQQEAFADIWDDRRVEAGDDWYLGIESAINQASVAILMISANFLTSKFILGEEVPKLLERRTKEGVQVIPIIVKPCAWAQVKWLRNIQTLPRDGRSLSSGNDNQIDTDLATIAEEIIGIISRTNIVNESIFIPLPPDKISLSKLPSIDLTLFGREKNSNNWMMLGIISKSMFCL